MSFPSFDWTMPIPVWECPIIEKHAFCVLQRPVLVFWAKTNVFFLLLAGEVLLRTTNTPVARHCCFGNTRRYYTQHA